MGKKYIVTEVEDTGDAGSAFLGLLVLVIVILYFIINGFLNLFFPIKVDNIEFINLPNITNVQILDYSSYSDTYDTTVSCSIKNNNSRKTKENILIYFDFFDSSSSLIETIYVTIYENINSNEIYDFSFRSTLYSMPNSCEVNRVEFE